MWPKVKPAYLIALAWMFLLAGCKPDTPSAITKLLWPDLNDPYIQLTKNWTRKGVIYSGIDTEIEIYATLKSLDWRKAYVHKWAQVYSLSPSEEKKLLADELRAAQNETEIFLALYSNKPEQAELKFNSPLWSVFLETAQAKGEKFYPLEIRPLDWPYAKLKTFFPFVHKWQKSYILRFKKLDLLPNRAPKPKMDRKNEGKSTRLESVLGARLTLSGPVGEISLEW
ncbi:hypothetical protein [Desulfovulcanus sp.]